MVCFVAPGTRARSEAAQQLALQRAADAERKFSKAQGRIKACMTAAATSDKEAATLRQQYTVRDVGGGDRAPPPPHAQPRASPPHPPPLHQDMKARAGRAEKKAAQLRKALSQVRQCAATSCAAC